MSENKNTPQSADQGAKKSVNPFGNLKPAEIPTRLHTYTYNGNNNENSKKNNH